MDLDDIDIPPDDKIELDALCVSMTESGYNAAKKKHLKSDEYEDDKKARKELRGKWEGYHLVEYAGFIKSKTDDKILDESYALFRDSAKKVQARAGHGGGKNKNVHYNTFKGLAIAQGITLMQCFVDFLEYCADANNGEGLPISIYQYDRHILQASINKKKAYIDDELARISGSSGKEVKKLDGLHIFWEQPNNEHEKPVCHIEACIAKKDLFTPNTFDNINLEQPSTVLRWSSNLTRFVGRGHELKELKEWLEDERPQKSIKFISGSGGAGKTRLAFEFADSLNETDWSSGQTPTHLTGRWRMGQKGMLLIVDYPEERHTSVRQFLKAINDLNLPKNKHLRIILLSRKAEFYDIAEEEAPSILANAIHLSSFDVPKEEQIQIAESAWHGLLYQRKFQKLDNKSALIEIDQSLLLKHADTWLELQDEAPTPLMIMALIYYIFLEPEIINRPFNEITNQRIIRYMTKREIKFIRKEVEEYFSVKKLDSKLFIEDVFLIRAVAAINGGFTGISLRNFIGRLNDRLPKADKISPLMLKISDIYSGQHIEPLQPDILAADFLHFCLNSYAIPYQGEWITAAVGFGEKPCFSDYKKIENGFLTLDRLIFDAEVKLKSEDWPIDTIIEVLSDSDIFSEQLINGIDPHQSGYYFVRFLNAAAKKLLKSDNISEHERARYLLDSVISAQSISTYEKLEILQEAREIYQRLYEKNAAEHLIGYIACLNCISSTYIESNEIKEALHVGSLALDLFTRHEVNKSNASVNLEHFCICLMTMARCYDNSQNISLAIDMASKSVEIRESLYKVNRNRYGSLLATGLSSQSILIEKTDNFEKALNANERAIQIFIELKEKNPSKHLYEFAKTLGVQSNLLQNLGQLGKSLNCIEESVSIFQKLSNQNPEQYLLEFLEQVQKYSIALSKLGNNEKALEVAKFATLKAYKMHCKNPHIYSPHYASQLYNLSVRLSYCQLHSEALQAISETCNLYRDLNKSYDDRYQTDLARSFTSLSIHLLENQMIIEAVEAALYSIDLYEVLAGNNPNTFKPNLAYAYLQLASCFSLNDKKNDAFTALKKATLLYEELVKSQEFPNILKLGECLFRHCYYHEINAIYLNRLSKMYLKYSSYRQEKWINIFEEALSDMKIESKSNPEIYSLIVEILNEIEKQK